jgi:hypothetical protein
MAPLPSPHTVRYRLSSLQLSKVVLKLTTLPAGRVSLYDFYPSWKRHEEEHGQR